MSYLTDYWSIAKATHSYWQEQVHAGHYVVLATFLLGGIDPSDVDAFRAENPDMTPEGLEFYCRPQTRHIIFVLDARKAPFRSLSYEPFPNGVFMGEATCGGLRMNHGLISEMAREEFLAASLKELFKSGTSPSPQPAAQASQSARSWWNFWG